MTDTLLDYDPSDTGEIPPPVGETRIRIDPGEITRNIGPYSEFARPIRRPDALDAPTVLIEVPLGLSFIDLAAAQPVSPWERVIDIESTVVYRLDGELRPAAPGPVPVPLPPNPPPAPKPGYVGRHRLSWGGRVRRLLAGMGVVGLALVAIWAGLILAGAAVFL